MLLYKTYTKCFTNKMIVVLYDLQITQIWLAVYTCLLRIVEENIALKDLTNKMILVSKCDGRIPQIVTCISDILNVFRRAILRCITLLPNYSIACSIIKTTSIESIDISVIPSILTSTSRQLNFNLKSLVKIQPFFNCSP